MKKRNLNRVWLHFINIAHCIDKTALQSSYISRTRQHLYDLLCDPLFISRKQATLSQTLNSVTKDNISTIHEIITKNHSKTSS